MKSFLVATILCINLCGYSLAQQVATQAPATKEDVEKYLELVHSHDMIKKMTEAMSKPMHQMVHDEYVKDKDKLPADFEARMNKMMDDMLGGMDWDQMIQAMVPVYQKHFAKADLDALIVFYSSPTGQKVLQEMPEIMADTMAAVMPILRKHIEDVQEGVQQQIAEMLKESQKRPDQGGSSAQN